MHPELLNNSLFLRYYQQWQKNPDSVVFASIAEFFLYYGLLDEALKICRAGLTHHTNLTTGRIVMAKIHLARGNLEEAEEELNRALLIAPHNQEAKNLLSQIRSKDEIPPPATATTDTSPPSIESLSLSPEWQTITMARIYASQGHNDKAQQIFHTILEREPGNEEALQGLAAINS